MKPQYLAYLDTNLQQTLRIQVICLLISRQCTIQSSKMCYFKSAQNFSRIELRKKGYEFFNLQIQLQQIFEFIIRCNFGISEIFECLSSKVV